MEVSPRFAQLEDAPQIFELSQRVAPVSQVEWSLAAIGEEIANTASKVWILEDKKELSPVLGFIFARQLADNEWEIRNFAIDPDYWGTGLGHRLIEEFKGSITRPVEVFLEVAVSNLRAIRFYEEVGAKKLYLRKNLYKDDDGWVYVLKWS